MNKKRLLKLADFLETVPRRALKMDTWVTRRETKPEGDKPGECGFAGCAMGWAAHSKKFPGLKVVGYDVHYAKGGLTHWGYDAAQEYFGVQDYIFCPLEYPEHNCRPTPKQVAKRIRKFVETGEIA